MTIPPSVEVRTAAVADLRHARRLVKAAVFFLPWIPGVAALGVCLDSPPVIAACLAPAVGAVLLWVLARRAERRATS